VLLVEIAKSSTSTPWQRGFHRWCGVDASLRAQDSTTQRLSNHSLAYNALGGSPDDEQVSAVLLRGQE